MQRRLGSRRTPVSCLLLTGLAFGGCAEWSPSQPTGQAPNAEAPVARLGVPCVASIDQQTVRCAGSEAGTDGVSGEMIGGQGTYLRLASSNVSYNAGTGAFEFDVTVQNLLNESIGTPGSGIPDPNGIRVFFAQLPQALSGSGTVDVANPDGLATFTAADQPYFAYHVTLAKNETSPTKRWRMQLSPDVETFGFTVFVQTEVERLLVINEVLANPGGTISDASGEWIEIYNGGTLGVQMGGLFIADSAASGLRPYHLIDADLWIGPGEYVVFGNTTNTTNNGGVPVDYAYGNSMALANSLDAIKLSRVFDGDTITIDRVQYASAAISAQNGISRELRNPLLDNSNMDGSNWADPIITAVYGPGGRGTPGARNSTFTP